MVGAIQPHDAGEPPELLHPQPRVLLVDGDVDSREVYALWLKKHGFEITMAATSDEALRAAGLTLHDVVVTELMLPATDGLGLVRRLLRQTGTCDAVLIVLTTQGAPRVREAAILAGAHGYLVKPCLPRLLGETITTLFELRRDGPAKSTAPGRFERDATNGRTAQ